MSGDEYLDRMVRRRIGLDALRRLRRLIDGEREADAANARWAPRLAWAALAAASLALALLASLR
jgi:hypothetical protein